MKNNTTLLLYLNFLFLIFLVCINIGLMIMLSSSSLESFSSASFNPEYQHPASFINGSGGFSS